MALVSEAIPKSNRGRKGIPLDLDVVKELAAALKSEPVIDGRPAGHRTADTYPTKGKASSQGRRYADAVAEITKGIVRVNVFEFGTDPETYGWRVYVPLEPPKKEKVAEK